MSFFKQLQSKTVWGGFLIGLSQVVDLLGSGMFGPKAGVIAGAVGTVLVATGVRDAIAKNGKGV